MFKISSNKKMLKGVEFIDLFCGIGGFHQALSSYGAECVFASEIDDKAKNVYENNYKLKPQGDIRKIKSKDIPRHDILCAGFPCQAFSISGKQNGFKDDNGKLFFEIVRIARYHKPKVILLENVKNLMSHDNGKTIMTIEKSLTRIGYKTYKKVLCASDFGVPQARKRLYIVALNNEYDFEEFFFPTPRKKKKILKDILQNNVGDNFYIDRRYEITVDVLGDKDQLIRIGSIGLGRQGERIYSIEGQAVTLSSQGGGIGGKTGLYYINNRVRRLTPRECARLMGFPESFKMGTTENECYKQFGNSVVINVIQEIVREISKYFI